MACFPANMGGHNVFSGLWADGGGNEGSGGCVKAVQNHQTVTVGCPDNQAGNSSQLIASHLGENIKTISGIRLVGS